MVIVDSWPCFNTLNAYPGDVTYTLGDTAKTVSWEAFTNSCGYDVKYYRDLIVVPTYVENSPHYKEILSFLEQEIEFDSDDLSFVFEIPTVNPYELDIGGDYTV